MVTLISFSQSYNNGNWNAVEDSTKKWIVYEDKNPFDGHTKNTFISSKIIHNDFENLDFKASFSTLFIELNDRKKKLLVGLIISKRYFNDWEFNNFIENLNGNDANLLFNFDDDGVIYSLSIFDDEEKKNIIFLEELKNLNTGGSIDICEFLEKLKKSKNLFLRVINNKNHKDVEFSLLGSADGIDFVIDEFDLYRYCFVGDEIGEEGCGPRQKIIVVESEIEIDEELEIDEIDTEDEEEIEFEEEEEIDEVVDFAVIESSPIFPGCKSSKKSNISDRIMEDRQCLNNGIMKHIRKNFMYPEIAKEMGIQEKIYVKFVIDKNGEITDVGVLRGGDKYLKEEAIRLVKSLPKMTPANLRGKPVAVNYTIPISFVLN